MSEQATSHAPLPTMTATYSPEDNKLRLYTTSRLDSETYERVKAAGFKWAPKQELWVAPMWTPERADLLMELCGEIDDEDKSLVERAEERAERFEDYGEKRAADAEGAHQAVAAVAQRFEFGQPILVGHHSEKKARKDAERIENGMRKAVKMWETSKYWVSRAKGALAHAKYKERPDVRHRRIKGLESDKRKQEKEIERAEKFTKAWHTEGLTLDQAKHIANFDHIRLAPSAEKPYGSSLWEELDAGRMTVTEAIERATRAHERTIARCRRWVMHIECRIAYERAMLGEQGGVGEARFALAVGGKVLAKHWRARGGGWLPITKLNKDATGAVGSVSTPAGVIPVETVTDYREPEEGAAEKVKAANKLPPLVNHPSEGALHITKAEWDKTWRDYKGTAVAPASEKHGAYRYRRIVRGGKLVPVYLTDAKRVDPPAPGVSEVPALDIEPGPLPEPRAPRPAPEPTVFDEMKDALRKGVAVVPVSAPQLFPTPAPLADRMVKMAGVEPHHMVLEPSSGTGRIYDAIRKVVPGLQVVAVEINEKLARVVGAICADFLTTTPEQLGGFFDRILMNPPFANGADVEHVWHAFGLLRERSDAVLVSVMSAGVKFRSDKRTADFRALIEKYGEIEDLPEDTFKESGTSVRTVLVTLRK